ncbi:MAG: putative Ig domain-containing protein [Usitatibacteraceae bacterium]
MSGTPALGTVGTYNMTFSALNNAGPQANQSFVLTIAKASQTITFADPADRPYSPTPVAFAASASSGIAVTYASSTTPVCTVTTAGVLTMLTVGTCTITASQIGDANFLPAADVPRSFEITQSTQSIGSGVGRLPWGTPSNRSFVANATFALSPLAVATSGLPVSYASLTTAVCTISGTTITMVSAGTCTIEASQDGNANYVAAADQQRSFSINKANQTITFPAQNAQPYSDGGTFSVTAASGGASGNPVTYTSLSTGVCTINGTLVNIVSIGVCTIAANQLGDSNYNAATQVTATIAINAVAPGSPIATDAVGSDGRATISFSPPATDGGSPITGFTATCNPGNLSGSAASSPISVTGLANTVQHVCTVVTNNAIGASSPSNTITVTPFLDSGANLWTAACAGCHGAIPAGTRFNAAGTTGTVLQYVRANVPEMLAQPDVQALSADELAEIAKYIKQQTPAISVDTAYQTPKLIDIGFPLDLTLNTVSFTSVEAVTQPANGVLSSFTGTTVTYTPNAGFAGTDTFTYRGKRTSPTNLLGDPRTVTVNVLVPAAPVVTSQATANGVFGQAFSYQITASNSPASFAASNLPPGISVLPVTGLISGTPSAAGVFNATITATNPGGTSPPAHRSSVLPSPEICRRRSHLLPQATTVAARSQAMPRLARRAARAAARYRRSPSPASSTGRSTHVQ